MTNAPAKYKVTGPNGLGEDDITRNVTVGRTHDSRTDGLWYEINIPYFYKEKTGIIINTFLKLISKKLSTYHVHHIC